MGKTAKPSGLRIARNGMNYTFSWKIADKDYNSGQTLHYRTNNTAAGKWNTSAAVGNKATSKTVSFSAASYYPTKSTKLTALTFRIRGRRAPYTEGTGNNKKTITPTVSDWATVTKKLTPPAMPTLSAALDGVNANVCRFTWSANNKADNAAPFVNVEWQSIMVRQSDVTDGSKLGWSSKNAHWRTGTGGASGTVTITEQTEYLAAASYTRWVRVRARGCAGASAWRYAKHVYAKPNKAVISSAKATVRSGITTVLVEWGASAPASNPIDTTSVEWAIETPDAGMACPATATWTEESSTKATGKDAAKFEISSAAGPDQCLYVRVITRHDSNLTYSDYKRVSVGKLTPPENLSVQTNDSTFRAIVTAENMSAVPDSRLAVVYRPSSNADKEFVVGIIPAGQTSVTVQCPDWSKESAVAFGVYAFQGSEVHSARDGGVYEYAVTANMKSDTVWSGGAVPLEPSNVNAAISPTAGEVEITWGWAWRSANRAEISWSQNPNAWESTSEPQRYVIDNLNASKWRVSGLATGTTWYFRVRLGRITTDEVNWGPYADAVSVDLSSAPSIPALTLSASVVTPGTPVTASWVYVTTDGTPQAYAEICEATINGSIITYGQIVAHATGAQNAIIDTSAWESGTTHNLCVRVASSSGHVSDGWSTPVSVTIAEELECEIEDVSFVDQDIEDSDGVVVRTVPCLLEMPLTVTVTGAGDGGTTTVVIERAAEYHMIRPDNTELHGHEGETIAIIRQTGEEEITIENGDLIGVLDDGAPYRLIASVEDGLGQTAEASIEFEVHWTHQAGVPGASVEIEGTIAKITPIAPEEYAQGDVCDIYRLSADRPELIVQNGEFGTMYVDPYPAIGEGCGHRIVHRTVNGDYITSDDTPAWTDIHGADGDLFDEYSIIIDFGHQQVRLPFDINLNSRWAKDFELTTYLGGSQQGDWNPAVTRTGTYSTNLWLNDDEDMIAAMRELSVYDGICHVRTPEGSSFCADVQVSESKNYESWEVIGYTLTVTRVDPEELDGMTYEEYMDELE